MAENIAWTRELARDWIAVPSVTDDKYSRGVLGVVTGSEQYPGAAVLSVDAALHTGIGMVRYLGPAAVSRLVLSRRPEVVTATGRVQAWLVGSGMAELADAPLEERVETAIASGEPIVLDAGAIGLVRDTQGPSIVTPHAGELARLLGTGVASVIEDPVGSARRAASLLGITVLLKGNRTTVAWPGGGVITIDAMTTWLATAGTGDALGGILGALVATHSEQMATDGAALAKLGATASIIHSLAAHRAGRGGPFTVLDLNAQVPSVIAELVA